MCHSSMGPIGRDVDSRSHFPLTLRSSPSKGQQGWTSRVRANACGIVLGQTVIVISRSKDMCRNMMPPKCSQFPSSRLDRSKTTEAAWFRDRPWATLSFVIANTMTMELSIWLAYELIMLRFQDR